MASSVEISLIKLLNRLDGVRLSRNSESLVATRGWDKRLTLMMVLIGWGRVGERRERSGNKWGSKLESGRRQVNTR